jgi:VanZ family protein
VGRNDAAAVRTSARALAQGLVRLFDAVARWPAVVLWMALLFALSSIPSEVVQPSGAIPLDKVAHFCFYGVLGALLAGAIGRRRVGWGAVIALAVAIGALYGVSDEFHQRFVPGRDASVDDWIADVLGTLTGAIVAVTLRAWAGSMILPPDR